MTRDAEGPSSAPDDRYQRQAILPGFGPDAQARLGAAHAAVVGCGALGGHAADLLARAGVGRITLVDRDVVELTNLQRQPLFAEADMGRPKATAGADRLRAVNSEITIEPVVADLVPSNAEDIVLGDHPADAILDGTDNFETRFLLNDLAVRHGVPLLYAGVVAGQATVAPILPGRESAPCLRCLIAPPAPGSQPTCDTAGVFGPAVAIASAAQASDAIKLLAGLGDRVGLSLLRFDLMGNTRQRLDLSGARDPSCPCCGAGRFEFLDGADPRTVSMCGRDAVQIHRRDATPPDLGALADRLSALGAVERNDLLLRAALPDHALTVFADGRAIVHGTTDPDRARAVYDRYVGT